MRAFIIVFAILLGHVQAHALMEGRWSGEVEGIFNYPATVGPGSCDTGFVEVRALGSKGVEVFLSMSCAVEGKPAFNMIPIADLYQVKGDKLYDKKGYLAGEIADDSMHLYSAGENWVEEMHLKITEQGLDFDFRALDAVQNSVEATGRLQPRN